MLSLIGLRWIRAQLAKLFFCSFLSIFNSICNEGKVCQKDVMKEVTGNCHGKQTMQPSGKKKQ